jgi:hypothetical protein
VKVPRERHITGVSTPDASAMEGLGAATTL